MRCGSSIRIREMYMTDTEDRPPLPPFTRDPAIQKVRLAEDGWYSINPARVAAPYSMDCIWRNRAELPRGRQNITQFLQRKWARVLNYRLIKELWAFPGERTAVRFVYEWHDDSGNWYRSCGNVNRVSRGDGRMIRRYASINDLPRLDQDRRVFRPLGRRPVGHPGLSELGL